MVVDAMMMMMMVTNDGWITSSTLASSLTSPPHTALPTQTVASSSFVIRSPPSDHLLGQDRRAGNATRRIGSGSIRYTFLTSPFLHV
jgi:hypothetical protein